jgi:uncharacterized small protein (DUF1192 family)
MTIRTTRPVVPALILGLGLGALAARGAEPAAPAEETAAPVGTPVKWDQDRVTQYASELNTAIADLRQEIRRQPAQTPFAKRQAQRDLDEDMRLIDNSTSYLLEQLKSGAGREETEATFRRIDSLRLNAAEHAKRSLLPDPLMKDLVHAGELWNRMKPYYYGKR